MVNLFVSMRIWDHEDELYLIKAMVQYKAETSLYPTKDFDRFLSFLGGSIVRKFSRKQILGKIGKLKRKFNVRFSKINNQESEEEEEYPDKKNMLFHYSKLFWGPNNNNRTHSPLPHLNIVSSDDDEEEHATDVDNNDQQSDEEEEEDNVVSSSEMNPHAVEETIRTSFKVDKASGSRRVTRSSTCGAMRNPSPAASSHGRDIVEAGKVSITETETPEANQLVTESPLLIPPPVLSIEKEYVSTATPSPVITSTPLEQKETENEGNKQPKKTQRRHDGLGNDSIEQKMHDHADLDAQQPLSTDTDSLAMDREDNDYHRVPKQMQHSSTVLENSMDPDNNGETVTLAASGGTTKETDDVVMNDQTPSIVVNPSPVITEMTEPEPMKNLNSLGNDCTQQKASGGLGKGTDDVVMNDQTLTVVTSQVTPTIADGSLSTATPTPVITENMELEPNKIEWISCINHYKSRKRKRDQNHNSSHEESDVSSVVSTTEINGTSGNICNDGDVVDHTISSWMVNISNGNDALVDLPFAKKSKYWEVCESTEEFKSVPQRPHFIPLLEEKDAIREWTAIGMMVNFYELLEEVKNLKLDDSVIKLNELSVSFAELEKHGFDVVAPQSRIDITMSLKDRLAKREEEMKCFEKKIDEGEKESRRLGEEKADLKLKILELQRQEVVAEETDEAVKKAIVEMKTSIGMIHKEIEDVEFEFQKSVSAPWN